MLSIETARKLKDAGLEWEPQVGDWFTTSNGDNMLVAFQSVLETQYTKITNGMDDHFPNSRLLTGKEMLQEDFTWLPRLDRLLAEIEKRGYWWLLRNDYCYIATEMDNGHNSYADSPAEAAAQALLWILQEGKE